MARPLVERQLTKNRCGRFQFAVASREDDAEIRRLFRENPMAGDVSLSFEREPDYFADTVNPFESKQTIVARADRKIICVGNCSVRQRFINGAEARVGYLGGLRLAASHAGRTEILRAGYEFFHELQLTAPAEYYFTSIASDNLRARRVLERGLPGMPTYQFIGELVTLMISTRRSGQPPADCQTLKMDATALVNRLNTFNRNFQLAPAWSEEEFRFLSKLGLSAEHFFQCGESLAALWNQSAFKQTVIRRYAPNLANMRPLINLLAALTGGIRLPAVGERLRNACVSHLITGTGENNFIGLLNGLRSVARQSGVDVLTLALAADDERLSVIRSRFHVREYGSRIYLVHWPDCGHSAERLEHHRMAPEVALL